jgi:hypothetical protein
MNEILGLEEMLGEELLGELLEGEDESAGEDAAAILGADDALAVLGAALRAKGGAGKKLLAKTIAARKLGSSQILSPRGPSSSGVQPIGFEALGVAAGAQQIVTTQPQTWFKPMRLVFPDSIAPFFTLNNIIIGNKSQFPSPVAVPGETFIPSAEAVVMELDTVNPALNLTLVVTNISGVAQNFRATFVGKQVTP